MHCKLNATRLRWYYNLINKAEIAVDEEGANTGAAENDETDSPKPTKRCPWGAQVVLLPELPEETGHCQDMAPR
ncbi:MULTISPECIES: hypothetical protein [Halomonadaceae]|uniref:Uncharacterized protein n=1 Tax=Vreelandella titanicae TaxID=664683 RepID=A0A653Z6C5_9GAMM|nr:MULTISPECIES: hypothetical protein [Halomonas]QKS25858.1 hypothetical protein FX987_03655 [Halomonas titanicae]TMU28208.1 hypothetical protein E0L35_02045 [Halomonas sp. ATBC28]CAD5262800.1 conserved hypothetical protein [Halomonas sp. 113]CAD5264683.1 conserved hypothetical protein [Halomonas sp. 59]CAD5277560.1 conserved hypothetical protein [Halomonas sp. I3]|tara:strand:+ start:2359 stop:2580 length:222 start_codon:yes stop_codon:yes gene_type:complete